MTAEIISYPAEERRGRDNARLIIRAYPGHFSDAETLDATEFLIAFGDALDRFEARAVQKDVIKRAVAEMNGAGRGEGSAAVYAVGAAILVAAWLIGYMMMVSWANFVETTDAMVTQ